MTDGKYGLLRALFPIGSTDRLGIVWYLVPDEVRKSDGRHIDYLNTFRFKGCDPELFDALRLLIRDGVRNVSEIENTHLFPSETVFYRKELSFEGVSASNEEGRDRRLSVRQQWLDEAFVPFTAAGQRENCPFGSLHFPTFQPRQRLPKKNCSFYIIACG